MTLLSPRSAVFQLKQIGAKANECKQSQTKPSFPFASPKSKNIQYHQPCLGMQALELVNIRLVDLTMTKPHIILLVIKFLTCT